ncbi:MAG: hypothetical protein ACREEP_08385, partial [Dongiaceae bacterium]
MILPEIQQLARQILHLLLHLLLLARSGGVLRVGSHQSGHDSLGLSVDYRGSVRPFAMQLLHC